MHPWYTAECFRLRIYCLQDNHEQALKKLEDDLKKQSLESEEKIKEKEKLINELKSKVQLSLEYSTVS